MTGGWWTTGATAFFSFFSSFFLLGVGAAVGVWLVYVSGTGGRSLSRTVPATFSVRVRSGLRSSCPARRKGTAMRSAPTMPAAASIGFLGRLPGGSSPSCVLAPPPPPVPVAVAALPEAGPSVLTVASSAVGADAADDADDAGAEAAAAAEEAEGSVVLTASSLGSSARAPALAASGPVVALVDAAAPAFVPAGFPDTGVSARVAASGAAPASGAVVPPPGASALPGSPGAPGMVTARRTDTDEPPEPRLFPVPPSPLDVPDRVGMRGVGSCSRAT